MMTPEQAKAKADQLDLYREYIQYAPRDAYSAPDLRGWTDALGVYLCALCAGRIMARGCSLKSPATPDWADATDPPPCTMCNPDTEKLVIVDTMLDRLCGG